MRSRVWYWISGGIAADFSGSNGAATRRYVSIPRGATLAPASRREPGQPPPPAVRRASRRPGLGWPAEDALCTRGYPGLGGDCDGVVVREWDGTGYSIGMYDDDHASCKETFATFRLFKDDLRPQDVSRMLGLEPSRAHKKGEPQYPKNPKSPAVFRSGGWLLTTEGRVESRDVRRHVDWLLERLEAKRETILRLPLDGYALDVFCFWCSASGQGGPQLDVMQMRRLADLGIPIRFDIYFSNPTETSN